jgi:predicted P-loop ATPase
MSIAQKRDYEQLKNGLDIESLVKHLLPNGNGYPEWKSINPTRDDKRAGSFQVNLQSGMWIDFATDEGGDILDLYVYIKGCSISEAYDSLDNNIELKNATPVKKPTKKKRPDSILIYPPPADAFEPIITSHDGRWCYRDKNGVPLMFVTRHNLSDGGKYYHPHTYRQQETGCAYWDNIADGMTSWPLLNLDALNVFNDRPVLVVEGEKTADAAQKLLTDWVITTWHGGANAFNRVDLDPLQGRKVWLWPDNDDAGISAMNGIKKRLEGIASMITVIQLPRENLAKGWDLADGLKQGITREDVMELIENRFDENTVNVTKEFDVKSYPEMRGTEKKPIVLDTTKNLNHLLTHLNIKTKWNMMSRIREVVIPSKKFYIEEQENAALNEIHNIATNNYFPVKRIDKHLDAIAWDNLYHPIREWILSKPLEEKGIFEKLLTNIQTSNNDLSYALIKRWMISAVASAFNDSDFCAQGVLVLLGETGTHKSSFIMSLAPKEMRAIKGAAFLDPSNKDSVIGLSSYWIAELAELNGTFKKADIERLKAHITNDIDDVRRPFAAKNSQMIRRTVYAATVNELKYLVDTNQNRRWWTIHVTEPINTRHGLDMQQIWREIYDMWISGESPELMPDEMKTLNKENLEFEHIDPFEEKIFKCFNFDEPGQNWMTASFVLEVIGYANPSKSDATRMAGILIKMQFQRGIGRQRRSYLLPTVHQMYRIL